jgi:hypothetical protein
MVDYLTPLIGIVTGTVIGVVAEPIRTWLLRPRLRLRFDPVRCVTSTPTYGGIVESRGHYVRVQVINRSGRVAKACRVFLVDIEQMDGVGIFRPTVYLDSLRLKWASQLEGEELRPLDLVRGVSQFVDVISTDKASHYAFTLHVPFTPGIYAQLFGYEPKTLRLTILATGDDVKPATTQIVFAWDGQWDTFMASAG